MSIPNRVWFSLLENQKTFCFSYCDNFMQIKISSLLPYPNITIKRPHLTLLTIYILWAIFPPKEVLASCFRIQSKQQYLKKLWPGIKMHYKKTPVSQPSPGCTVPLTQWPNMAIPCRHLMTHHLPKRCGRCVALRRLKLGTLRWCYLTLSMYQLVTVTKVINRFQWILETYLTAIQHRNHYPV